MAADGFTKPLVGQELQRFTDWNSGRSQWRPFDRAYKSITAERCANTDCRSKWLVHAYCAKSDRMVSTCKVCDFITLS